MVMEYLDKEGPRYLYSEDGMGKCPLAVGYSNSCL